MGAIKAALLVAVKTPYLALLLKKYEQCYYVRMKLRDYLSSKNIRQHDAAKSLKVTQSTISQLCREATKASAALAIEIEKYTDGAVLAETLHPDADFSWLRGKKRKPTSAS